MSDRVEVATSGMVKRNDRCSHCLRPMLYRVDTEGKVRKSFCGNSECHMFLVEIAE